MDRETPRPERECPATRGGLVLEEEFNALCASLAGDVESRREGDSYLATTHALYHGRPLSWAFTPKILTSAGAAYLAEIAETMGSIMAKVTRAFQADAKVRAAFALPREVEELCVLPCGYAEEIPLARVDIFLDERTGAFQFCELNTDGSAGMTSAVEVTNAIRRSATYRAFAERHGSMRTFDVIGACADAILATYDEWEGRGTSGHPAERPVIGVVDYGESISADEVAHFVEHFAERGIACRFSEIRELEVASSPEGPRIADAIGALDVVWRRAVLSEMLEKPCAGSEALVRAQAEGLACVVGGFRTWPCATKTVFAALRSPVLRDLLTPAERRFVEEHVPYTEVLSETTDLSRFVEKDRWIVKPQDGYNAMGVVAGLDETPKAWQEVLLRAAEGHSVIQRYAPQFRAPVYLGGELPRGEDPLICLEESMMEGLFLFRGRFAGVFTRCGREATIGEWTDRLNMGCLVVDDEPAGGERS